MLIRKEKYHNDVGKAYVRGLEQGFELASKLKNLNQQDKETDSLSDKGQSKELSLLLHQLLEIAKNKGIDLQ
jgi:hypothetical protein